MKGNKIMIGQREFYKQVKAATGVPEKYVKLIFGSITDILIENYKNGETTKLVEGIYFRPAVHHNTTRKKLKSGLYTQENVIVPKIALSKRFKENFREKIKG